jgi:predicted short-subunit dehydrogenase-like oxidoreductase (DUF2520 family)
VHHELQRIAVVGAGRVGANLARRLTEKNFTVTTVVDESPERLQALSDLTTAPVLSTESKDISEDTEAIFFCVPDERIAAACEEFMPYIARYQRLMLAHTSGLRTSDEFPPSQHAGLITGSFHPMQSFHSCDIGSAAMDGIGCGLEGTGPFIAAARPLALRLGWRPVVVRKELKPLYHAACALAGNFVTALAADAHALLRAAADVDETPDLLLPMMLAATARFRSENPANSLTGPIARGDVDAIRSQTDRIRRWMPEVLPLYRALAERTLFLARLPEETEREIRKLLREFDGT